MPSKRELSRKKPQKKVKGLREPSVKLSFTKTKLERFKATLHQIEQESQLSNHPDQTQTWKEIITNHFLPMEENEIVIASAAETLKKIHGEHIIEKNFKNISDCRAAFSHSKPSTNLNYIKDSTISHKSKAIIPAFAYVHTFPQEPTFQTMKEFLSWVKEALNWLFDRMDPDKEASLFYIRLIGNLSFCGKTSKPGLLRKRIEQTYDAIALSRNKKMKGNQKRQEEKTDSIGNQCSTETFRRSSSSSLQSPLANHASEKVNNERCEKMQRLTPLFTNDISPNPRYFRYGHNSFYRPPEEAQGLPPLFAYSNQQDFRYEDSSFYRPPEEAQGLPPLFAYSNQQDFRYGDNSFYRPPEDAQRLPSSFANDISPNPRYFRYGHNSFHYPPEEAQGLPPLFAYSNQQDFRYEDNSIGTKSSTENVRRSSSSSLLINCEDMQGLPAMVTSVLPPSVARSIAFDLSVHLNESQSYAAVFEEVYEPASINNDFQSFVREKKELQEEGINQQDEETEGSLDMEAKGSCGDKIPEDIFPIFTYPEFFAFKLEHPQAKGNNQLCLLEVQLDVDSYEPRQIMKGSNQPDLSNYSSSLEFNDKYARMDRQNDMPFHFDEPREEFPVSYFPFQLLNGEPPPMQKKVEASIPWEDESSLVNRINCSTVMLVADDTAISSGALGFRSSSHEDFPVTLKENLEFFGDDSPMPPKRAKK